MMTNPNNRKFKTRDGQTIARIYVTERVYARFMYRIHGENDWTYVGADGRISCGDEENNLDVMKIDEFDFKADSLEKIISRVLPEKTLAV